jgi:hypothetical protein
MKIFNQRHFSLAILAVVTGGLLTSCTKLEEKVFNSRYVDSLAASGGAERWSCSHTS